MLSAGVACVTFVYSNVKEQTLEDFNSRKKSIDEKLKNLYGPLYGNRLLFQSAIEAVENFHQKSIEDHIKEICKKRDSEGLEDWRGYYKRRLAKLDHKALEIIQANSHLIHDDESRTILRAFLKEGFLDVILSKHSNKRFKHHVRSISLKSGARATSGIRNMTIMIWTGWPTTTTTISKIMSSFAFIYAKCIGTYTVYAMK